MSSSIGDLFPYGDADEMMLRRAAERFPGLPVEHAAAAFELLGGIVELLEAMVAPLEAAGLSPARWRLLVALLFQSGTDGASIGELAAHLGVREPTMTATVDRAERDGIVTRSRSSEDRRIVMVTATPAGQAAVAALLPGLAGRVRALVGELGGPAQASRLAASLKSAIVAAEGAPEIEIKQERHATHR